MKLFALEDNSNQCDVFRSQIRSGRALWGWGQEMIFGIKWVQGRK
jgi:hypothetical protein